MLESPLVPDGSSPGTHDPLRSERPLSRREIREREALRAEPVDRRVDGDSAFAVSGEQPGFDSLFAGLIADDVSSAPAGPAGSAASAGSPASAGSAASGGRDRGARARGARETRVDEGRAAQAATLRAPEANHEAWMLQQRAARS